MPAIERWWRVRPRGRESVWTLRDPGPDLSGAWEDAVVDGPYVPESQLAGAVDAERAKFQVERNARLAERDEIHVDDQAEIETLETERKRLEAQLTGAVEDRRIAVEALGKIAAGPNDAPHAESWAKLRDEDAATIVAALNQHERAVEALDAIDALISEVLDTWTWPISDYGDMRPWMLRLIAAVNAGRGR